jgi:hypothetical protein
MVRAGDGYEGLADIKVHKLRSRATATTIGVVMVASLDEGYF